MIEAMCLEAQATAFPGVDLPPPNVQVSTKFEGVDYQNNSAMPVFGVLKKAGSTEFKSPRDVAQRLADAMKAADKSGMVASTEVAGGGFINIALSTAWLSARVQDIVVHGVKFTPATKLKVAVDFSSPNVAKEMHAGHLRSTIIGDTICRVLEFAGHEVLRINHVGDWGTQFGMLIAHLKDVFPDFATKPPPISDLQQFYKNAKKVFDADADFKARAHQEVVRLQGGDGASRFAWQQICDVSRREFEKVYARLSVTLTEVGESYYNEYIPAVISHLQQVGLVTESDGAKVIFPPGSKHENPLIVQKGDGGYGYDSTDMAAVWYRLLELKVDQAIYVTDTGQGPHFDLIFDAARAAGWKPEAMLNHVPFGLVQAQTFSIAATLPLASAANAEVLRPKLAALLNGVAVQGSSMITDADKQIAFSTNGDGHLVVEVNDLGAVGKSSIGQGNMQAAAEALTADGAAAVLGIRLTAAAQVEQSVKTAKFKTRSGETVRLVDLLDAAVAIMQKSLDERAAINKCDLSPEDRAEAAKALGYGAVKYADLKGNRSSNYVFDYDRMLDAKGNTAVYLLYASARTNSVLNKGGLPQGSAELQALIDSGASVQLTQKSEFTLAKEILRFQEVVEQTLRTLLPSVICEYLYGLSDTLNKFYDQVHVLNSPEPEKSSRLLLLLACLQVMQACYQLLGITYLPRL